MNKIVASFSLAAIGTAGLHAAAPSEAQGSRFWSVSGTFDGFYDDNVNSTANAASYPGHTRGSTGFSVTPAIALNWPWDAQSSVSVSYAYTYKYYENKPLLNTDNFDQIHNFALALDHSFSENYSLALKDSLVVGQEPDLLRSGNLFTDYARVSGDNIRNVANVSLDGRLTSLLSFNLSYVNAIYKYADDTPPATWSIYTSPSTAGILDRIDQTVRLDSRWQVLPESIGVVGFQFFDSGYTGNQQIDVSGEHSNARNSRSYYGYVGVDQQFSPTFSAAFRIGGHYTDYYNDPTQTGDTSPYAQLSLHYSYGKESYVEGGFTMDRSATDLIGPGGAAGVTVDASTESLYGTIRHRLAPSLFAVGMAQFQNSEYNGGYYDGKAEQFYTVGVSLEYKFNPYVSAHLGYNYDRLESEAPMSRTFDRNRVYLGFTATY